MAVARKLGLVQKYIQEVEDWDTSNKFPEVEFTNEDLKAEIRKPKEKKIKSMNNILGPGDQTKQPNNAI